MVLFSILWQVLCKIVNASTQNIWKVSILRYLVSSVSRDNHGICRHVTVWILVVDGSCYSKCEMNLSTTLLQVWKSCALSPLQTYRKEAVLISSWCLLSVWRSHKYPWLSVHSTKHLTEIYWRPFVPQQTMLDHFVIQTENNIFYQHYQQVSYVSSQIKTICWSGQWSGSWSWDKRTQSKPPLFRTTSVEGKVIDRNSVPLKFEDIVDKKIYDKMRPPKPGGKICIHNMNYLV